MEKLLKTHYEHKAFIRYDDSTDIVFNWHFPRGTLDERMSGLELAGFLMGHMPSILPLLSDHPKIWAEFKLLLTRFATWGSAMLDEVLPWVKSVRRTEEDDLIVLDLNDKRVRQRTSVCFDMGR